MDMYVVLAQIMIKFDNNLSKVRQNCVPELIEEDEFWYNYFYKIECIKASMGLPNALGPLIDKSKRKPKQDVQARDVNSNQMLLQGRKQPQQNVEIEMQSMKPQMEEEKKEVDETEFEVEI